MRHLSLHVLLVALFVALPEARAAGFQLDGKGSLVLAEWRYMTTFQGATIRGAEAAALDMDIELRSASGAKAIWTKQLGAAKFDRAGRPIGGEFMISDAELPEGMVEILPLRLSMRDASGARTAEEFLTLDRVKHPEGLYATRDLTIAIDGAKTGLAAARAALSNAGFMENPILGDSLAGLGAFGIKYVADWKAVEKGQEKSMGESLAFLMVEARRLALDLAMLAGMEAGKAAQDKRKLYPVVVPGLVEESRLLLGRVATEIVARGAKQQIDHLRMAGRDVQGEDLALVQARSAFAEKGFDMAFNAALDLYGDLQRKAVVFAEQSFKQVQAERGLATHREQSVEEMEGHLQIWNPHESIRIFEIQNYQQYLGILTAQEYIPFSFWFVFADGVEQVAALEDIHVGNNGRSYLVQLREDAVHGWPAAIKVGVDILDASLKDSRAMKLDLMKAVAY